MGYRTRRLRAAAAVLAATVTLSPAGGPPAFAFEGAGGALAGGTRPAAAPEAPRIRPSRIYPQAIVATGGTGLRNLPGGGIDIAGLGGATADAWLYWAVITEGEPKPETARIALQRNLPTRAGPRWLTGTPIGRGANPCWDGDRITVYRVRVPVWLANGNGSYLVTLPAGLPGSIAGEDPWTGSPLPAYEGASLVLIQRHEAGPTVAIFDSGLAGLTFVADPGLDVDLVLPAATVTLSGAKQVHIIGADGQDGWAGYATDAAPSGEVTRHNGVALGGPGSPRNDSDWNGSAGQPLTKLWDNRAVDATEAIKPGDLVLDFTVFQPAGVDCLTPVAVVVQG
ncbi:MAG: hypothetical protein IT545_14685 [Rhodobacteraceae bacterium]|nr:hypothetical protein [Paracoccaceae bacterium]